MRNGEEVVRILPGVAPEPRAHCGRANRCTSSASRRDTHCITAGGHMITHEEEIIINRPVEAVFAYLTDVSTYPRWQPDLIEYRLTSAGPLTTGSTGVAVRSVMGQRDESTWQVIELVPNARY